MSQIHHLSKALHSKSNDKQKEKQKLTRKSTRSMSSQSRGRMYSFGVGQDFDGCIEPPSPVSSSEEGGSSAEVKYLSYLAQVIDSAPEGSNHSQIQTHYHNAEYWHIVFQSAIYVKKDVFRTQIDDNLITSEYECYLKPNRIHPQAINPIGLQLLANGYFLCGYAIATGRKRKSAFIFKYLMQYFRNQMCVQTNQEEFGYLLENYVYTDRVDRVLHITSQIPSSQNSSWANLSTNHINQLQVQQSSTPGNVPVHIPKETIRSPYIRIQQSYYNDEESNRSRTIVLDDGSEGRSVFR